MIQQLHDYAPRHILFQRQQGIGMIHRAFAVPGIELPGGQIRHVPLLRLCKTFRFMPYPQLCTPQGVLGLYLHMPQHWAVIAQVDNGGISVG